MKRYYLPLVLLAFVATVFLSCSKWKTQTITEMYNPLILSYTSGEISVKDPIVINFSKAVDLQGVDSLLYNKFVDVYPSEDFQVEVVTSTSIKVIPVDGWQRGQKYRVKINLNQIFGGEETPFLFDVYIKKVGYSVFIDGFKSNASDSGERITVYGSVVTSEAFPIENIRKGLSANYNRSQLSIDLTKDLNENSYRFEINLIKRANINQDLKIEFKGESIAAEKDFSSEMIIPSNQNFSVYKIANPAINGDPFKIYFTDPLQVSQNMDGLIVLGDGLPISYSVDRNILSIYPQQELVEPLKLELSGSIINYNGKSLGRDQEFQVAPLGENPSVEFVTRGAIYPDASTMVIPFKAINLKAVTVRIVEVYENNIGTFLQENNLSGNSAIKRYGKIVAKRHLLLEDFVMNTIDQEKIYGLDLSKFVKPHQGSLFMVSLSFRKEFVTLPCAGKEGGESLAVILKDTLLNEKETAYFSTSYYWENYSPDFAYNWDDYDYDESRNPCSATFYMQDHSATKMVMVSDLGVICNKLNTNSYNVVISSITSSKPISGVKVKAFNLQNQVLSEQSSNSDGVANFYLKENPSYFIAYKNDERGYLKLSEENKQAITSFETEGYIPKDGLKGYLYGDRGVWRPNDTLYLSFILQDDRQQLPIGHPIVLQLFDNQSRLIQKELIQHDGSRIYAVHFHIPENGTTGLWQAKATVGEAEFQMPVRVETIRPNRLRMSLNIENKIYDCKSNQPIELSAQWLTGLQATGLKFDLSYTISELSNPFPGFESFSFTNPFSKIENREMVLAEDRLDETGHAKIENKFVIDPQVGLVKGRVKVRVYENGGDFSTDFFETKLSTSPNYCGVRVKDGAGQNGSIPIDVVTINENGNLQSVTGLQYVIYRVNYNFWYQQSSLSQAEFISSQNHQEIQKGYFATSNGQATLNFKPITDSYWVNYLLLVYNPKTGNCAGTTFAVEDGIRVSSYGSYDKPDGAQLIKVKMNEKSFAVGQEARVSFPSVDGGNAVITLFKGDTILLQERISTDEGSTDFKFKVTEDMIPNIYLSVNTLKPFKETKTDMPVRMYGVASIPIEDTRMRLHPIISVPSEIRPNSVMEVKVSEEVGQACDYTLAIVDEGLLDITRFKTPDPYGYFFQKEALTAETYDLYNFVLGGYFGGFEKIFGIGGDMGTLGGAKNQKASRFKPMVKFVGPFHLDAKSTKTHRLSIPYYVGSVRVMVVAAGNKSYGNAEKRVTIKNDFMVVTSLPRTLSPNDVLQVPITLFSDSKVDQNIELSIQPSSHFVAQESLSRSVVLKAGQELTLYLPFTIASKIGNANFKVLAQSNGQVVEESIDIEVRNPNPPARSSRTIELKANEERLLSTEHNDWINHKASVEIASAKPLNLSGRMSYLIQYPHGCVEQTTSSVFPQLYLSQFMSLSINRKTEIERNVKTAISKLALFQKGDGGFSYWQNGDYSDNWGSSYAGHFLIEAERMGYAVPVQLLKKWKAFQSKSAREWKESSIRTDGFSVINGTDHQAYRLFTLALAQQPDLGAMNRLRTIKSATTSSKWLLAYSYVLAGQSEVAAQLVFELRNKPFTNEGWEYSYGSVERDRALMLSTLVALNSKSDALEVSNVIADELNSNRYMNTQAVSLSLVAMAQFYEKANYAKQIRVEGTKGNNPFSILSNRSFESFDLLDNDLKIKNLSNASLFVTLSESGVPNDPIIQNTMKGVQVSAIYRDRDGNTIDLNNISQNADISIIVTVTNTSSSLNYRNLALTQMVPSGWEIRNLRLEENEQLASFNYTYQDIRDDRVFTYFDLAHGASKSFTLMVTPSYKGSFFLPAICCESMYSSEVFGQIVGQRVEVR